MNQFILSMDEPETLTENGMPTNSTSESEVLNLFYKAGGMRAESDSAVQSVFASAYRESRALALRCLFHIRNVRGGMGERRFFRLGLGYLAQVDPELTLRLVHAGLVEKYGRWDDLLTIANVPGVLGYIENALAHGNGLCAKWMPRETGSDKATAKKLRLAMGISPKEYRHMLVGLSKTVEQAMCAKEWSAIEYSAVPSRAAMIYRKAFIRHDEERFAKHIKSGKVKSGTLYPHEIVKSIAETSGVENDYLEAAWKNLPDYCGDVDFIPVCDVSGSMSGDPILVSVGLGIYLAERNKGAFKDRLITFSKTPRWYHLSGTLTDRVRGVSNMDWGTNTNIEAVFRMILDVALKNEVAPGDMPQNIIILSDMQFDQCAVANNKDFANMVNDMYKLAGYTMPKIVFWNLRTSSGVPAKKDEKGAILVSGFSPSAMKAVLSGSDIPEPPTPYQAMMAVLEQYAEIDKYL